MRTKNVFVTTDGRNVVLPFALVSLLFLLWGFCNGMIDVMDKHFQEDLGLNLAQSAWVQTAHYLGYFLMALPAGWVAQRYGYKGGILVGLVCVAVGGLWFIPAMKIAAFWSFLLGICVIAAGLAFLETVANPYVTVLGDNRHAAMRINLAQSLNGIGWILGPVAGAMFFYSKDSAGVSTGSQTLWIPFVTVAGVVLALALVFSFANIPEITVDEAAEQNASARPVGSVWQQRHFTLAIAAQFLYVAAQAGIFSFFINYITAETPLLSGHWQQSLNQLRGETVSWLQPFLVDLFEPTASGQLRFSSKLASYLASAAFICFLIGRFSGAALLRKFSAHRMLALYAVMNVLMCLLIYCELGWFSVLCVFLSYFFMSIMFPTIFALGIAGLGSLTKSASAYLVMAIVGGAVLPKVMGAVADSYDLSRAFVVPMICFAFIAFYGYKWPRLIRAKSVGPVQVAGSY